MQRLLWNIDYPVYGDQIVHFLIDMIGHHSKTAKLGKILNNFKLKLRQCQAVYLESPYYKFLNKFDRSGIWHHYCFVLRFTSLIKGASI